MWQLIKLDYIHENDVELQLEDNFYWQELKRQKMFEEIRSEYLVEDWTRNVTYVWDTKFDDFRREGWWD